MSQPTVEQLLTQFYDEIHAWIGEGTPAGQGFRTTFGLCYNLELWVERKGFSYTTMETLDEIQSNMFLADYGTTAFPFNFVDDDDREAGMCTQYDEEAESGTIFQNPKRLAWINCHRNQ